MFILYRLCLGLRNFIFWTIAVAVTVYVLDSLLFGTSDQTLRQSQ